MSLPVLSIAGQYDSSTYEKERVVVDKPCVFQAASCFNNGLATLYLIVMDKATNGGTWPSDNRAGIVEVPPQTARSIDWTLSPRTMQNGIYVAVSTDPASKVLPATNDVLFGVAYAFK
jgi:hypothetical protein